VWTRNLATALTALLILAAGATTEFSSRQQGGAAQWVAHTHEVISRLEAARAALVTAESAQRAFLLTANPSVMSGFRDAEEMVHSHVTGLGELTADNPAQQRAVQVLRRKVEDRFALMREVVALKVGQQEPAALDLVGGRGLAQHHDLNSHFHRMRQAEEDLLRQRLQWTTESRRFGVLSNAGTTLLALLLVGYLVRSWRHHEREMGRKAEELGEANLRLQQAAQHLERRVAERTNALSDANAELEAFARSVAHDLRAPVRNIQGYAEAVIEDQGERMTPEGGRFMQRLLTTARRMEELISGLLEYSRLARADLPIASVDPGSLLRQALDQRRPEIEATRARVALQGEFPPVLGHRATLLRVFDNLIANALKFVAAGSPPELDIAARRQDGSVVLAFQDRGIGIAREDQERVFHAFERLHGQESYPGTGIGLAIVRRGVERMGGKVVLSSTPASGSRFELHLLEAP
jgi:signal transduction histidine kinase